MERHSASCLLKPCAHHLITDSFFKKKKKKEGEEVKTHIHKPVDSIRTFW